MTPTRAARLLLAFACALLVVWAFLDVAARLSRGDSAGRTVELTILHWGDPDENAIVQKLVDRFEREHPTVKIHRLHASDYDSKLKTMMAAGTPPDLFYLASDSVPEMAGMKLLTDLTPRLDAERAAGHAQWLDDFYPILLDAFRYDGKHTGAGPLYGLPKDFTTMVMYVNCDLFHAAGVPIPYNGWTWDQYEQAMRRITALSHHDGRGQIYGGMLNTWPAVLRNILWNYGGEFFGDDFTDVRLDSPGSLAAIDMIRRTRFVDKSVFNATGISKDGGQEFYTGNIGCIGPVGRWMTPRYRSISNFQWDCVPLPHGPKPGENASTIATVAWVMSRHTAHPAEAFELMKFLCGPEGQTMSARLGLAIPSLKSVANSNAFLDPTQKPAHTQLFLDAIARSRLPQSPPDREWNDLLSRNEAEAIQFGRATPKQAAQAVQQQWTKVLASPLKTGHYHTMPWTTLATVAGAFLAVGIAILYWLARRDPLGRLDRRQEIAGWLFIAPWLIGLLALTLGPMIVSLLLALARWTALTPLSQAQYVGLDNFRQLFTADPTFGQSMLVTLYFVVLAVPLGQIAALAVAMLMNLSVRGIGLFRTAYFVPSVVSGVALATLWLWIFNKDYGLLNAALAPICRLFGATPPDWFGLDAGRWAVPAFVLMGLWGVGGGMVIYLAGLKGIPTSLYEAARIDGAGPWRRFWNVTLPMLSPLIFYNLVMGIIGSFQIFTQAKVMTNGGPGDATLFYVLNLYRQAFEFHNMGYASAIAWVLFILLLILTLVVFRLSKNLVYYEGLKS